MPLPIAGAALAAGGSEAIAGLLVAAAGLVGINICRNLSGSGNSLTLGSGSSSKPVSSIDPKAMTQEQINSLYTLHNEGKDVYVLSTSGGYVKVTDSGQITDIKVKPSGATITNTSITAGGNPSSGGGNSGDKLKILKNIIKSISRSKFTKGIAKLLAKVLAGITVIWQALKWLVHMALSNPEYLAIGIILLLVGIIIGYFLKKRAYVVIDNAEFSNKNFSARPKAIYMLC